MTVLHYTVLAAVALTACLGAAPALAKPQTAPDICHSRYLVACMELPAQPGQGSGPGHRMRPAPWREGAEAGPLWWPRHQSRLLPGRSPLQGPF